MVKDKEEADSLQPDKANKKSNRKMAKAADRKNKVTVTGRATTRGKRRKREEQKEVEKKAPAKKATKKTPVKKASKSSVAVKGRGTLRGPSRKR